MCVTAENRIESRDIRALISCSSAKLRFMLAVLTVTFAAFMIFSLIVGSLSKNFGYLLAGLIWCALVYIYVFIINPPIVYRSFKRRYTEDALVRYEFKDNRMSVHVSGAPKGYDKKKKYADMFKAYETDDYFFFYFKRNESFIMKKSGISSGSFEEISQALENNMGKRFIRKVSKK